MELVQQGVFKLLQTLKYFQDEYHYSFPLGNKKRVQLRLLVSCRNSCPLPVIPNEVKDLF